MLPASETACLDRGDGVCRHFNERLAHCPIYPQRPDICRVDRQYALHYRQVMTWQAFVELNQAGCHTLQTPIVPNTNQQERLMSEANGFSKEFSDDGFWNKVIKYAKTAGQEVIEKALWLYYAAQNPQTPTWAKTTIYGALGYFILPIDAIPDMLPGVGYTDDLGVIAAAITAVSMYITDEVKQQAAQKLRDWFGA